MSITKTIKNAIGVLGRKLIYHNISAHPRKIFVCGCGHSGTSLIASMLGSHPQIFSINAETYLFVQGNPIFKETGDNQIVEIFNDKYLPLATAKGATIICEKTPIHIHCLSRIRRIFPGSQFVVPVRDPRDMALSMKLRTADLKEGYERWLYDNEVVKGEVEAKNRDVFVFRYEDLIEDPQKVLRRICNQISLEYNENMLDFHKDPRPWFGVDSKTAIEMPSPQEHPEFRNWQIKQPLFDRRGRWKDMLSEAEVLEVERSCHGLMSFFQYYPKFPDKL